MSAMTTPRVPKPTKGRDRTAEVMDEPQESSAENLETARQLRSLPYIDRLSIRGAIGDDAPVADIPNYTSTFSHVRHVVSVAKRLLAMTPEERAAAFKLAIPRDREPPPPIHFDLLKRFDKAVDDCFHPVYLSRLYDALRMILDGRTLGLCDPKYRPVMEELEQARLGVQAIARWFAPAVIQRLAERIEHMHEHSDGGVAEIEFTTVASESDLD